MQKLGRKGCKLRCFIFFQYKCYIVTHGRYVDAVGDRIGSVEFFYTVPLPSKHKTSAQHPYNVGSTSKTHKCHANVQCLLGGVYLKVHLWVCNMFK